MAKFSIIASVEDLLALKKTLEASIKELQLRNDEYPVIYDKDIETLKDLIWAIDEEILKPLPF